jgi:hypothetical protein
MFLNPLPLLTRCSDGLNHTLEEPLVFQRGDGTTIRARAGSTTDGFSTPREIWSIIPPFGPGWYGSIMHDAAYRQTLEQLQMASWKSIFYTQAQGDALMLECLTALGVGDVERQTIYQALVKCGKAANLNDMIAAAIPHGLTKEQLEEMQAVLRGR